MNALDILRYGHLWVLKHVEGLADEQWEVSGVCGVWSVKEIIAHLASFEVVLTDILAIQTGNEPTPTLSHFKEMDGDAFNTLEVGRRKDRGSKEVLAEYCQTCEQAMKLLQTLPPESLQQPGLLPWYGLEYSLDDFIVYSFYGHKREHCAQIAVFLDHQKFG